MRLLIHTILTLMIAAILGGVALFYVDARREESDRALVRTEVGRFQKQIHLQAALAGDGSDQRPPLSIDPKWFDDDLPKNALLGEDHPWVEIAGPDVRHLRHPADLTARDSSVAAFWYNPANGIVRARVPQGISDAQVLQIYNEINDTALRSVFPGADLGLSIETPE